LRRTVNSPDQLSPTLRVDMISPARSISSPASLRPVTSVALACAGSSAPTSVSFGGLLSGLTGSTPAGSPLTSDNKNTKYSRADPRRPSEGGDELLGRCSGTKRPGTRRPCRAEKLLRYNVDVTYTREVKPISKSPGSYKDEHDREYYWDGQTRSYTPPNSSTYRWSRASPR
jgi:hypothetical protein